MAYARWRHILMESQRHALKAVDEWNCTTGNYSDFLTHMHKAWHYLLHAEFHKAKIDYYYRDPKTGHHQLIDGEPQGLGSGSLLEGAVPQQPRSGALEWGTLRGAS